jgi:DNA-binding HxlR family transcriptional regulator
MEFDKLHDCPVMDTIHAIGGKWKPRILWHLRNGAATFGELSRAVGISEKVLLENLRALQRDGLISRRPFKEGSVEFVEYQYTDYGRTLVIGAFCIRQDQLECADAWREVRRNPMLNPYPACALLTLRLNKSPSAGLSS